MESATWCQLKLILEQALECNHGERRAFVAQACANAPTLRDEIYALLDEADAATEGFLESPATLPTVLRGAEPTWIGKQVDTYRITRKIGSGGMGQVFLAEDDGSQARQAVAVKVMRGDVDSPALCRRFDQERRIHATLDHPFIARMLGEGSLDNRPYMLLEHVAGQPIDAYCRQHRLALRERIALVIDVSAGVQHVHEKGVVHRDIKCANILVTADGRPKLLDLGIAELLETAECEIGRPMVQLEGLAMFTPECAAPEQLRNQALTKATDIYGLGLLLYVTPGRK